MPPRSLTMFLAEIGTAGAISAYFFRHITSAYSLNVSDQIKGQPVQLSDYLFVFGCGLVFWLLVMLRAKLYDSGDRQADIRKVAKLAKLIAPITALNLCGCLLAPFMKLPLLVRFLVLFQVSCNLAPLLIWAFLSLKECMIVLDAHPQQQQKSSPEPQAVQQQKLSPVSRITKKYPESRCQVRNKFHSEVHESLGDVACQVQEAGGRDIPIGCARRVGCAGRDIPIGCAGRDIPIGCGGGSGVVDTHPDVVGGDPETNTEQVFKSSNITEMSLMLTAQTTAALIGFHLTTPSKALLVFVLIDQLVAYLCCLTSILLSLNKPEYLKAAKIFQGIGFVCTALGFILMVAMFVPWYLVLIAVLLFGVVWLIFFWNGLKTRASEVWNYLKNSTQSIKNCIGMLFENGS